MNEQLNYLATLGAIIICFVAVLITASFHPVLLDKTDALGIGVIFGGLLGALSNSTKGKSPPGN